MPIFQHKILPFVFLILFLTFLLHSCAYTDFFEQKKHETAYFKRKNLEAAGVLFINQKSILPLKNINQNFVFLQKKQFPHFDSLFSFYAQTKSRTGERSTFIYLADENDSSQIQFDENEVQKIYVFLGKKENIARFLKKNPLPDALLFLPENSPESQEIAAQMLFGGLPITGEMTENLPFLPNQKQAFFTPKIRFSYSSPAEGGMSEVYEKKINALTQLALDEKATPGAQILIARKGEVLFMKSYGRHTYDSNAAICQNKDLYDLASVSKILTALPALMHLHGEGKFFTEAKVEDYLPEMRHSDIGGVRFRDLLAHHAGIPASAGFWVKDLLLKKRNNAFVADKKSEKFPTEIYNKTYIRKNYYRERLLEGLKKVRLAQKNCFLYTDVGFWLLPAVTERITGEEYGAFLQKNLYEKLGTKRLLFNPLKKYSKTEIVPTEHEKHFFGGLLHGNVHDPVAALMEGEAAHAGLFGNAHDTAVLMQMYLNGGTYGGERFFPAKTLAEFTACAYCAENNHRGLGFDRPKLDSIKHTAEGISEKSFGHLGFTGNYVWADKEHDLIYVFLSNRVYPSQKNNKLSALRTRLRIQEAICEWLAANP
jgi:CubicO group peptidase (beta-lactamase class C family)